jgi:uncharacterized coiled-coil DUF342 family protein
LKAKRDSLDKEAQAWAEKRDRLHEEMRKIRLEAKDLRDKRDELNTEIQFLKTLREERWKKRAEAIEQLKTQRRKMKAASATKTARSSKSLEGEIAKVEWKIQTEPHSLEEEKKLVNRVKTLEVQLQAYRQIQRVRNEITNLGTEAQTLREGMQTDTRKILELAEQSQKFHENMIKELEKVKTLKTEADEIHHKYVESKEKAKACHSEYMRILEKIKALRAAIQLREEEERSRKQADFKKRVEDEASDKLRRGKKLSFEEFKILAEQGKI